jgi:hypothetical protein
MSYGRDSERVYTDLERERAKERQKEREREREREKYRTPRGQV